MKLLNVFLAQTTRLIRPNGSYGYLPEAARIVTERYQFAQSPPVADLAAEQPKPLNFSQGRIKIGNREIPIGNFQIYPLGILVSTRTNTNDSDLVIEDAVEWASTKFNIKFEAMRRGGAHYSQLEVRLDKPLDQWFPQAANTGPAITEKLGEFWESKPTYRLSSVAFYFDNSSQPAFAPGVFRLERRSDHPFEQEVYWAEAPLATNDHLAVLTQFERSCLG